MLLEILYYLYIFLKGKLFDKTVSDEATWTLGRYHIIVKLVCLHKDNYFLH